MSQTRRLTAILAADVAGYSRLMGVDEEGTHERVTAHLRELVNPKIQEHRGRIVKNTGDGFLAEFPSVVDAVRCAVEIQRGMAERNATAPPEKRIEFRIGINLGDVIVEAEDIYGDGVNVAARLEALAEPGGICISRVVRDQIRDKLPYPFEDRGEQSVKNIARPVRVYALRPGGVADPPASSAPPATPISQPIVAPRLSIVVLPFVNLSNDPEQGYVADGITDDVTTDLSRIAGMFVISRNTAFTYRNKPVDTRQIALDLGVRYVLEGSIRRSRNQVRVNAQLIDAATDAHLWTERFDGDTADLFALQDEITSRIANALGIELIAAEAARRTERPDALDCILRGRAAAAKPRSPDNWATMISLFGEALALDPGSVEAHSRLASALATRFASGMSDLPVADIERAGALAERALMLSPRDALAHSAKGQVLRAQNRYGEAVHEFETVLALNRNSVDALFALGQCRMLTGSIDETIPLTERAVRLSPRDGQIFNWYWQIGSVHLLQSRTDEAIHWLNKARNANPPVAYVRSYLAAAYALNGQSALATAELAETRRLNIDGRYSTIARLIGAGTWGVPKVRALYEATYFAGLRKTGMPEE